jgi:hypothetical protein
VDLRAALAHPAFAPYAARLSAGALPDLATLNAWADATALALPDARPLRFAERRAPTALDYEAGVAQGVVATRPGNLHDALNALAWLAFPRAKAALNAVHVRAGEATTPNRRDRARDAATLLDESGLLLACADGSLADLLRAHEWRTLFVARRADAARALRPFAIGHGLLEKLVAPFRAITARVLVLPLDPAAWRDERDVLMAVDAAAARSITSAALVPESLLPLPVAALPGWDAEGLGERLFDDASVFRPRRGPAPR